MPADTYTSTKQKVDELFRVLNEADEKNWIVVGACIKRMLGLAKAHAYTVMGALKLKDAKGKEWNLLKMRNPWGSETYNGPWSDKDTVNWTPELRA